MVTSTKAREMPPERSPRTLVASPVVITSAIWYQNILGQICIHIYYLGGGGGFVIWGEGITHHVSAHP